MAEAIERAVEPATAAVSTAAIAPEPQTVASATESKTAAPAAPQADAPAAAPNAAAVAAAPDTAAPDADSELAELPLSFAQERLWFIDRLAPGSATYNVPVAIELAGPFDRRAWARAVAEVRRRHEALRTTFAETADGVVQLVAPPAAGAPPLPEIDLRSLPEPARHGERDRVIAAEVRRPFDLVAGPLFRAAVVAVGPGRAVALASVHHIVSDGWSIALLLDELATLYDAWAGGRDGPSPLPDLALQYGDYCLWQREWMTPAALAEPLAHFRAALAGAPPVLALPADRPRPPVASFRGRRVAARLPARVAARLGPLARESGATVFMTLLAGFAALLHRMADAAVVPVGLPVAGRTRTELEAIFGLFVNTVVVAPRTAPEESFRALLAEVRGAALAAYAREHLPFERLVEALDAGASLAHNPIYQVLFAYHVEAGNAPRFAGLASGLLDFDLGTSRVDLSLAAEPAEDGGLSVSLELATDLFDAATGARLLGAWRELLDAAGAAPETRLADLPLLSAPERHQLLHEWNDTAADFPRGATLAERFALQAARAPGAPALLGPAPGEAMTYGELARRSTELARRLVALGVGPESRVALLLHRSPELVVAILATLEAGGAYVPLDPAHPPERLAFLLADSSAAVLVSHRGLAARLGSIDLPTLDLDAPPSGSLPASAALPPVSPDNLAYVMYTSGSTGAPKGVAVTHRNVLRLVHGSGYAAFGAEQTFLLLAPASFDAATLEIWGPLLHGGRLALAPDGRVSLAEIAAAIRAHGVTTLWLTAGLFHQMVDEELATLAPLRQLLAGGDALSPPRVRAALARLPGTLLVNGYGPTEGTTFTCCERLAGAADIPAGAGAAVPIGRPIGNARAHVVDARLEPVPAGVPGELAIGGDGLARGYLDRPELTAERFVPDPFSAVPGERLYRTGDRVRRLADGRLAFLGRTDLQLKVAGQRIEPGEVEAALAAHPRVRAAAVAAAGEGAEGKRLVAFAVPNDSTDGDPDAAELRAWLAARLPEGMVPSQVHVVSRLPLTANGKVDRAELARLAEASAGTAGEGSGQESDTASELARSPVVEILAGLWADLLGRERVGLHDSFFELGGHSLLGARLVARIRHVLGREVSLRALFEEPTVAGLAARIERGEEGEEGLDLPPLVAVARPPGETLPASLTQRRLWFLQQLAPEGFFLNVPHAVRLAGDLAAPALARALSAVVARHAPLRSAFVAVAGEPTVRTAPPAPLDLPVVDLSALGADRREGAAREAVASAAASRFDLARPPLLRALLLVLAPADHVLALVPHHLVFDGWSMGVLFRELAELYGAFVRGRPSPLPPLAVSYADYADWQRRVLAGPLGERQLAYWRARLAGLPALDLVPDRPRPPVSSFRGGFATVHLPPALAGALAALGRRQGATLFMLVLAAWEVVLSRLSGQRDFPVGAPVAGRTRPELEELVGFFVNTLVLRADLEPDLGGEPSFVDLLSRARETVLGAYAHQELPFEELVTALRPERNAATNPLFDVVLSFEEPPAPPALPGLGVEPFGFDYDAAHFELMLTAHRGMTSASSASGELALTLSYRRELFDATTARRHLELLAALLAAAAADPETPALALPSWDEAARHQVLREWSAEGWSAPVLPTADRLALAAASRAPDALAAAGPAGCLSYGGLAAAAAGIGERLAALGIGRGARVAVVLERSPELAAAALAVLARGAAAVPVDPAVPDARLAEIVADSGARAVVARPATLARLPRARIAAPAVDVEAACRAALARPGDGAAAPGRAPRHGLDDLAYVIYTSGSTGRPKGVELVHDGLADLLAWHREVYGEVGRGAWTANPGFDAATWELWACLASGASLHAPPRDVARSPRDLLAWMAEEAISFAFLTTPLAESVVRLPPPPGLVLKTIATGGDRLRQAPVPEARYLFVNHYGPTETTVVSTFERVPPAAGQAPAPPLGRPLGGAEIYVLDRDLAPVPVGGRGEICLAGRCLARGYLGRPDATAERFVPHPFGAGSAGARLYRSGDLGRLLADGRLEFLGRADRQVKVRGFRVEPGEVEVSLAAHPAVAAAAVAVESAPGGARLVACIVPRDGAAPDAEALRDHLRATLPNYMVPALFVAVEALPWSANGKLDRAALARLASAGSPLRAGGATTETAAPQGRLELLLARLWREVLRLPEALPLSAEDNFFDLGGQSLAMVAVHERLREELIPELIPGLMPERAAEPGAESEAGAGPRVVELPLVELFEHTTIRSLAARLAVVLAGGATEEAAPAGADLARRAERQRQAPAWKERARQARRPAAGKEETRP